MDGWVKMGREECAGAMGVTGREGRGIRRGTFIKYKDTVKKNQRNLGWNYLGIIWTLKQQ